MLSPGRAWGGLPRLPSLPEEGVGFSGSQKRTLRLSRDPPWPAESARRSEPTSLHPQPGPCPPPATYKRSLCLRWASGSPARRGHGFSAFHLFVPGERKAAGLGCCPGLGLGLVPARPLDGALALPSLPVQPPQTPSSASSSPPSLQPTPHQLPSLPLQASGPRPHADPRPLAGVSALVTLTFHDTRGSQLRRAGFSMRPAGWRPQAGEGAQQPQGPGQYRLGLRWEAAPWDSPRRPRFQHPVFARAKGPQG